MFDVLHVRFDVPNFRVVLALTTCILFKMSVELREAIDRQNAEFAKHYAANDMEALKNLYTEDCRFMPQGKDTIIGNQCIPKEMRDIFNAGGKIFKLVTDEIGPLGPAGGVGDLVFETGHYKFSKSDGSVFAVGKSMVIWKKTSEGYKLYIDMFNDN